MLGAHTYVLILTTAQRRTKGGRWTLSTLSATCIATCFARSFAASLMVFVFGWGAWSSRWQSFWGTAINHVRWARCTTHGGQCKQATCKIGIGLGLGFRVNPNRFWVLHPSAYTNVRLKDLQFLWGYSLVWVFSLQVYASRSGSPPLLVSVQGPRTCL